MSWMLFTIFLATLLVIKGRYRKTDSCPSGIVQWRRREGVFKCQPETPYHCILMYNSSQLYETCIAAVTIGPGKEGCPWIMFDQDIPIHGSRNSECPVTNPECPPINHKGYLSNQLYQYPACFFESSKRTTQLKPSTVAENKVQETSLMSTERNLVVWIIVPIITIVLIVLAVIVLLRRKKVICSSDQESGRTKIEGPGDCNGSPESLQLIPTTNPEKRLSNVPLEDVVIEASPDNSKSENRQSQVQGSGKRQESESNVDCKMEKILDDTENGLSNGPLEDVVRVNNEGDEDPDLIFQNKDITSMDDRNLAVTQRQDIYDEDLAHKDVARKVFSDILEMSDGVVSYHQLLMHFAQKDNCQDILDNLEKILKGNKKMFRLLEDPNICFIIAYSPDADTCENYNSSSLTGECKDPNCSKFHICTSYVRSECKKLYCTLSHTFEDTHNSKVKERLHLSSYADGDVRKILLNQYPKRCSTSGCKKEKDCPYLHICGAFCVGRCPHGLKCRIGHSFRTEHNAWILQAYGISEDEIPC